LQHRGEAYKGSATTLPLFDFRINQVKYKFDRFEVYYETSKVIHDFEKFDVDPRSFVDNWQDQVDEMINNRAKAMVEEKFDKIRDKISDFENTLDEWIVESFGKN